MTPAASGRPPVLLATLRDKALDCRECPLEATRQHVVFGDGDPHARLLIVGEAPGAAEDRLGRPFQGAAGRTLDALLADIGLDRSEVYIANVVMCRPPGNRRPRVGWITTCSPYLDGQLASVRPVVTLALGVTAIRRMLGAKTTVAAARGQVHETAYGVIVGTYHPSPSSMNRDLGRRTAIQADFRMVKSVLDG
jgi:uracil-DNA glycosylase family 4